MTNALTLVLFTLTALLYLASWLRHIRVWSGLVPGRGDTPLSPNGVMAIALVAHTVFLWNYGTLNHRAPVVLYSESLNFLAWSIAVVFFLVNYSLTTPTLSKYITPIIVALFALSSVNLLNANNAPDVGGWLVVHIVAFLFAFSLFFMNFVSGVLYLIKERWMKDRRPSAVIHKLPPLELLDRLNLRTLTLGFPLLTFAIFLGILIAREGGHAAGWTEDRTVRFALAVWLMYAFVLHVRLVSPYQGRRVMMLTVMSFTFFVFAFVGMYAMMSGGLHSFTVR